MQSFIPQILCANKMKKMHLFCSLKKKTFIFRKSDTLNMMYAEPSIPRSTTLQHKERSAACLISLHPSILRPFTPWPGPVPKLIQLRMGPHCITDIYNLDWTWISLSDILKSALLQMHLLSAMTLTKLGLPEFCSRMMPGDTQWTASCALCVVLICPQDGQV